MANVVKGAIEEALHCKREGKSKTIVFLLSVYGYFDMAAIATTLRVSSVLGLSRYFSGVGNLT